LCDAEATPLAGLGPEVGRATAALHDRAGVRLRLGCAVMGFEGGERLEGVRLADGSRIEADVAVLALGGVPDTEWLAGSGLPHDDGVRCDATLVVLGHPDIAAAGDAASWPHPLAGGQAVRVEHRANASRQGRAAAANLLREPRDRRVYDDVPTFSTDQYGITVDALGLPRHAERFHTCEGDASTGRFVVAGERAGRIVAAIAFDLGSRLPAYLPLVERRAGLDEALAAMA
jgi:NADPH-dependent 2,4-dienoyl-CoA reductase/sulfur reductase-like enzyme